MLTPLPAASLMICSALPSRSLCRKLRREGDRKGVRWVYESMRVDPPVRQEDVAEVHAAHDYREGSIYRADVRMWKGVQEAGRKTPLGKGPRKDMRSLYLCSLLTREGTCKEGRKTSVRKCVAAGALTSKKANTLWGGGALQACDLRPPEDGGECSGTLASNPVVVETAERGMERMRASVSTRALTRIKCTLCGVLARRT